MTNEIDNMFVVEQLIALVRLHKRFHQSDQLLHYEMGALLASLVKNHNRSTTT
jgi:hypothetical protein